MDEPVCPVCKSANHIQARAVAPRIEDGFRVCIDCGSVFAILAPWLRESLLEQKRREP